MTAVGARAAADEAGAAPPSPMAPASAVVVDVALAAPASGLAEGAPASACAAVAGRAAGLGCAATATVNTRLAAPMKAPIARGQPSLFEGRNPIVSSASSPPYLLGR